MVTARCLICGPHYKEVGLIAWPRMEEAMKHYLAICIEETTGGWRVLFPEVPGCEARVHSLEEVTHAAETELRKRAVPQSSDGPVERSVAWLAENHVDISKAILTMVAVP